MDWPALVTPVVVFLAFGLTAWFIHRRFDRYEAKLDKFEAAHTACQIDLARQYAKKDEVARLWQRTDNHAERIAALEAKEELHEGKPVQ